MLRSLYLKNFVLIDEANLEFDNVFSVFTGETGAGKSILIDAIGLLCGDRMTTDVIRRSSDKMIVEGAFDVTSQFGKQILTDNGFGDDDLIVLNRELTIDGKSVNRCNGRIVPVSFLRELGSAIVDIHSQHDTQYLLNVKYHRTLLDQFGNHPELLRKVSDSYKGYESLVKEYDEISNHRLNPDDLSFLRYQIEEIEAADLKIGEDEELETQQRAMMAFEKISTRLSAAISLLDDEGGVMEKFYEVQKQIEGVKEMDEVVTINQALDEIYYALQENSEQIKDIHNRLYFDENELNRIQDRLFLIAKLKRKYGKHISEIFERRDEFKAKIEQIENREVVLERLSKQIEQAKATYLIEAQKLSEKRKTDAIVLCQRLQEQLHSLSLVHAKFTIAITESGLSSNGIDGVEFLVSMNVGEEPKPLIKVASGGELSRLMLGLKVIFSKLQGIETVIFDEIDSGVSGKVASAIGMKMHALSQTAQVFSVTHLGQVAACADAHYLVLKSSDATRTHTLITRLEREERIDALASIASGTLSDTARLAAQELLDHHQTLIRTP